MNGLMAQCHDPIFSRLLTAGLTICRPYGPPRLEYATVIANSSKGVASHRTPSMLGLQQPADGELPFSRMSKNQAF